MANRRRRLTLLLACVVCAPLAAQPARPAPAKVGPSALADALHHYTMAHFYEGLDEALSAIGEYEAALKSAPGNAQILADYAAALAGLGRADDAVKAATEAVQASPDNVDAHLLLGDIYLRVRARQDPAAREAAQREYEAVLKLEPDNLMALSSLGRLYVALGQNDKAESLLQDLINRQPEAPDELFLLAIAQFEQQKYDTALENLDRVLALNPSHFRAIGLKGSIYERLRNVDDAIAAYQDFLKLQPQDIEVKRRLASLLAEKGKGGDALQMLEELAKRNPFDATVMLELGKTQREQRKHLEAIASFRAAAKTDADNLEVAYWLAATLAETGEREEALSILKKLIQDNGSDDAVQKRARFLVITQMGVIQQEDAQFDAAVATFEKLVREYPDDFRSYLYLTGAFRLKKDWNRAADVVAKARQKFPDERTLVVTEAQIAARKRGLEQGLQLLEPEIRRFQDAKTEQDRASLLQLRLTRAQMLHDHKALAKAEAELVQLDQEFPQNELVRFQLGAIYEQQKKYDRAEQIFQELLKESPDNSSVLNYLGYMWADRNENLQEALALVKRAVEIDPFNGAYLDSLGWAQFRVNDLKGAEENLNKAARIVRNDATIHEHLGDLYEKLGNYDEALQAYRQSLSHASDDDDSDKIKDKIKRLGKLTRK